METDIVFHQYLGYSVHRNNIEEMTEFLGRNPSKNLFWRTPTDRTWLRAGDMIIVACHQIQSEDGYLTKVQRISTPVAVYSSSIRSRHWSKGRQSTPGRYVMTQINPAL